MAEKIEYTTPSKVSRYKRLQAFMDDTNLFFDIPKYITIPTHPDDNYFLVTLKYANRLDLIAHKFYSESKLWWVIATANNIEDPMDLPVDTFLRVPAKASLYGLGGIIGNDA